MKTSIDHHVYLYDLHIYGGATGHPRIFAPFLVKIRTYVVQ